MKKLALTRSRSGSFFAAFAVVLVLVTALWASPAHAHSELEKSNPAEGASVSSLSEITLTFGEAITPEFSTYTLSDSMKMVVKLGTPQYDVTKTIVTIPVQENLGGGQYTIGFSVLSVDGHTVTGAVHFKSTASDGGMKSASPVASGDTASNGSTTSSAAPIWYTVGGVLLGIVILAIIAWVIRRRATKASDN